MFKAGVPGYTITNPLRGVPSIEMAMRMLQAADMNQVCRACHDRSKLRDLTKLTASPMKYAIIDNGPYKKDEWSKGWTVELKKGSDPQGKRLRLTDPEFDFTELQETVREIENMNPCCAWSLVKEDKAPGESPKAEPQTPVETHQGRRTNVEDWVPTLGASIPVPAARRRV